MEFIYPEGATPLDQDAIRGLIPKLRTQHELNEFEGQNIADALAWARRSRKIRAELLTVHGSCLLHRRMFDQTWQWAGEFRRSNMNIGVDWPHISANLRNLCDDVTFWIAAATYPWPELAIRYHHRMILIHPFQNGNGRHGRLAANLLLAYHKQRPIDWSRGESLDNSGATRTAYIAAMRAADQHDYSALLEFAGSDASGDDPLSRRPAYSEDRQ